MPLIAISPAAHEVAVVNLPPDTILRVHRAAETCDYTAAFPGERLIAAIPGDRYRLGWGAAIVRYGSACAFRNGHHKLDRPVWHVAYRHVRDGGIALIQCARRD